ncbi:MAG: enoyl-CoA hydratase/isomerase family protein [Clostridiales Family XIII bacterium]|jgi:enoyl-CoA hydratase|nr:enoyl-CoA hydratase/isomerase family protein [Clostridiales Family XIII bacterium]
MESYKNLLFEPRDGVAFVTVNRPEAMNALNTEVIAELHDAFRRIDDDASIGAAVLTGTGKAFVAGADIAQMSDLSVAEGRAMTIKGQRAMEFIENIDKPTIAAVNGFALGGGCELAMACDIRLASEKARFGQPEVNLGIIPGFGGTQRLPRLVGKGMAKYLVLSAEIIGAEEALRIGLVEKVFPADALLAEAEKLARLIIAKAPIALKMAKTAVNRGINLDLSSGVAFEAEASTVAFASEDRVEGLKAFLEKRPPVFRNR